MKFNRLLSAALAVLLFPAFALAQQAILQGGPWTPNHAPMYVPNGYSQPIVQDSGPAGGGGNNLGLSELLLTQRSPTNAYPAQGTGTGPFGTNLCDYDAPLTNSGGYHYICMGPNALGGSGMIAYGAGGGASALPFTFNINGTNYQFPFTIGGIVGPATSNINDLACWNNTTGSLLKDCGTGVLQGPTSSMANDIPTFVDNTGRVVQDSGISLGVQAANRVLATPNGSSGAPTFRTLAGADLPTPSLTTLGGVKASNVVPHQFAVNIDTNGNLLTAALAQTDIAPALGATPNSPGWLWTQQQFFGMGNPSSNKLKTYAYGDNAAPGVFLNPTQGAGIAGAGWTSLNTAANNISIGTLGFGFADGVGTTSNNDAWGIYGECRAYQSSTGFCVGQELDATNLRTTTAQTLPYSAFAAGSTGGLHIASGGGCTVGTPCYDPANGLTDLAARQASYGLLIGTNTSNFQTGILFQCGSVGTTDCSSNGAGDAISLYPGASLTWYRPSNSQIFGFGASAGTTLAGSLTWSNSGLTVQGGTGSILHQFYAGATDVNGVQLLSNATSASPSVNAIGSDANIDLTLSGKGTGIVRPNAVTSPGAILSSSPTAGIGYGLSACGAVIQTTSRTTGVTINNVCGGISLVGAAGSTTPTTFTVANSSVAATDVIILNQKSGTDKYELFVTAVAAGSFNITFFTTGGTTTEQPVFNYTIIKG